VGDRFTGFEGPKTRKEGRKMVENPRRFSIWEEDGSEDGHLVANNMTEKDASLILDLLNAHAKGS
jgi:hypothetical protein